MNQQKLFKVLLAPHVSEKAALASESGQHVFKVAADASKQEIKHAVEKLFEVEVDAVRIVNIKGKNKRFGMREGRRSDIRKAYVSLKPGQSIELMSAE
jgi:large subunit ribosomal protein L23